MKKKAQKIADSMGLSLTSVIKHYLKHFIQAKSITFTVEDELPTQYMTDSLKQSEEDVKTGRVRSFDSEKDELAYSNKEIEDEKRKKYSH